MMEITLTREEEPDSIIRYNWLKQLQCVKNAVYLLKQTKNALSDEH